MIVNRDEEIFAVLAEIVKEEIKAPLPFLPDITTEYPKVYVAYLGENKPGTEVVVRVFNPTSGIGNMRDFDLATPDEIKKFEKLLLAEGHIRYKHPELSFEYIPVVGDMVVAWNDDPETATVGIVSKVDGNVATLNNGSTYEHNVPFFDKANYESILNFNKQQI